MTTLNQLTYDLLELIRSQITDDEDVAIKQIEYWVHNQRALWLKKQLSRFSVADDDIIQDLGCVELEIADVADCPDNIVGCSVLRTKLTIPDTIDLNHKSTITRVGPIDKTIRNFSFVNYKRAIFSGNHRLLKDTIYAFLLNDRIYLKFDKDNSKAKMITHINVRGVFEDPTEASKFTMVDGTTCYSADSKYPVNKTLINFMKDKIINADLRLKMNPPSDDVGDADHKLTPS